MEMESLEERIQRINTEEVAIAPYDPAWPARFEEERAHLLACLPRPLLPLLPLRPLLPLLPLIPRIEHFGSTAVPGLAAKPIVDMLVEVTNLTETRTHIAPLLEAQGYDYFWRPTRGDDGPPFYAWFIKRDAVTKLRTHHIHMVEGSFTQHWERLLFRDFLIAHSNVAREYEAVKRRLATEFPKDRTAYTEAKTEFIARVTEAAKASRA